MQLCISVVLVFSATILVVHGGNLQQCNSPSELENGNHSGQKIKFYKVGFTVKYWCKAGYHLQGSKYSTCIYKNGIASWSTKTTPICIPKRFISRLRQNSGDRSSSRSNDRSSSGFHGNQKRCPSLRPINGGHVKFTGTKVGSWAKYSCHKGASLRGNKVRRCLRNGHWSGSQPKCRKIKRNCKDLTNPQNGKVWYSNTKPGSLAKYTCFHGYILVGKKVRTCQMNGKWSNIPPICKPVVVCDTLTAPTNGQVQVSGTRPGSHATYSCNNGYQISNGNKVRNCLDNGKWSGNKPLCREIIIDCGTLTDPQYGIVTLTGTSPGSTATYHCNNGFVLNGDQERQCSETGVWSGYEPLCEEIICEKLNNPDNGIVEFTSTIFGSIATYTCNEGFVLTGNKKRECTFTGKWSGIEPSCYPIDCGELEAPVNGFVIISGTIFGSHANYSCFHGYELFGIKTRYCEESGEWSDTTPTCKAIDCGNLEPPLNGKINLSGTTFESIAKYSCNNGFYLDGGDQTRVCQISGEWSGEPSTCTEIECDVLKSPTNGHVTVGKRIVGSIALYSCAVGFVIDGDDRRVCQSDGQWSGKEPFCDALEGLDCGIPSNPDFGHVTITGTNVGSQANYVCDIGYEITKGDNPRTCQSDYTWSGVPAVCEPVFCGSLNDLNNGQVFWQSAYFGDVATYSCFPGYDLRGPAVRTCQADATWSDNEPICAPIDCGVLISPVNGIVQFQSTVLFSIARYTCDHGYELNGEKERQCMANGHWSAEHPTCESVSKCVSGNSATCKAVIMCGQLTDPEFGRVFLSSTTVNSTATYQCNTGYKIQGENKRVCLDNGQWSGTEPICVSSSTIAVCSDPGEPNNGKRIGDDFSVNARVFYQCNDGFILVGSNVRECLSSGKFSGTEPTCHPIQDICASNTVVFDQCGRRCDCVGGELVNCCRIRYDWASINSEEKIRYLNAVKTIASDPVYRSQYESLILQHEASFDTNAQSTDPFLSQYLPYSRYFLLEYENLLREIDCHITIPYWDWSAFPFSPYDNPVWDNDLGFGDMSRGNDSCVKNGPFSFDQFSVPRGGCVQRLYLDRMYPSRDMIERDLLPLPAEEFDSFHRKLQLFIGTNVLCFVGGNLCSSSSSYDPLFPLYLSYVDNIFNRWQSLKQGRDTVRYANDITPLFSAGGLSVADFSDNSNLPRGVAICYGPPQFHKRHPPPPASLTTSAAAAAVELPQVTTTMDCIDGNELNFMTLTEEDKAFMKKNCQ